MAIRSRQAFFKLLAPLLSMVLRPLYADAQVRMVRQPEYLSAIIHGRNAVKTLLETADIPGIAIAVGIGNTVVWSEGFGYADLAKGTPVTPRTQFRIASVSKLLTAAAVGKMYEQGRIDLDADVRQYVPSWPDKCYTITPRQLAGHLGGIREYRMTDFTVKNIDGKRYRNAAEALSIFMEDSLVAPPGTKHNYTSLGYTLLEAAMEGASKESFIRYMKRNVLDPLGMKSTLPNHPDSLITRLSTLYAHDSKGGNKVIRNLQPTYKFAGGGYVSTAEDLARFGMAHLRPGFLKAPTLEMLFQSQYLNTGEATGVGIGWVNGSDPWGRRIVFHNGNQPGARPVLIVYPEHDLVIAITTNVTGIPDWVEGAAMCIADPFLRLMAGEKPEEDRSSAGTYLYRMGEETEGEENALTGSITLIAPADAADGYLGWMDGLPGDNLSVWPIADVVVWPSETVALAATQRGLFLLRWQKSPDGLYSGFFSYPDQHNRTITLPLYLTPSE
ncbi:MAG: beta-lactamase family protein [Saprospiraceae bacterium]|nr:beta-lactamase family protein [Saprospiraceae bacterium]